MISRKAMFPWRIFVAGAVALLSSFAEVDVTEAQSRKQVRPGSTRPASTARPEPAPPRAVAPAPTQHATPRAAPQAIRPPSYGPGLRAAAPSIPRAGLRGRTAPEYRTPAPAGPVKSSRYAPGASSSPVRPAYRPTPIPTAGTNPRRPAAPPANRAPSIPRAISPNRGPAVPTASTPTRKVERGAVPAIPSSPSPRVALPRTGGSGSFDRPGASAIRRAPSAASPNSPGRAIKRIRPVDRQDLSPRAAGVDALPRIGANAVTPGTSDRRPRPIVGDLPRRAGVERPGELPPAERGIEYSGGRSRYPRAYDDRRSERGDRFFAFGAGGREDRRHHRHDRYVPCYDGYGRGRVYFGAYFSLGHRYHDRYTVVYQPYSYGYPYYDPWYPFYGTYGAFAYPQPLTTYSETTIYNQPAVQPEYREPVRYDVPDVATAPVVPPAFVPTEEEPVEDPLPLSEPIDTGDAPLPPVEGRQAEGELEFGEGQAEEGIDPRSQDERYEASDEEPAILVMGHHAFFRKQFEDASRYYFEAMMSDTDDEFAKLFYAMAGFARGDYASAAVALRGVDRAAPELIASPIDWRQFYPDRETLSRHIDALVDHLARETTDVDARLLLAYVYFATGEPIAASRALEPAEAAQGDELATALRNAVQKVIQRSDATPASPETRQVEEMPVP